MRSPELSGQESGSNTARLASWQAGHADAPGADDWAICCSGGGIRSAAYCLGALQSLDNNGLLANAKLIVGVSGGSYIAASRALVAHNLPHGEVPQAYAPGSPEERSLRDNTRYIAPNGATVLVGILSLLLGAIATFVLVVAPLYALAHAWGWLLRWQSVVVPSGPHAMTAAVTETAWWLPSVIVAGIMLALFTFWWLTLEPLARRRKGRLPWWAWLKPDDRDRGANRARLVSWAAVLTAGVALAMLAAPPLISWLTRSKGSFGTIAHFIGFGARPSWSVPALAGLIAAVAAIARFCQAGLAKWNALGGQAKGAAAGQPGLFTLLAGRLRQQLMPWLASAVIVLIGAVLALLWISDGARAGFTTGQLLQVIAALAVMLFARAAVNVNRMSMHDFYRWRLADAFAVTRRAARERDPVRARGLFAEAAATRLSQLRDGTGAAEEPRLVICGTANINADREVPPGSGGFCVSFDPDYVTLRRGNSARGEDGARALTSDYEALVGKRRCTLFDVSAISGAAISPLMGAATRHAYRILLTATNVRLGVWLPHPALVREARKRVDRQAEDKPDRWWTRRPLLLLLWYLSPHPLWNRKTDRNFDREARLWAHVLELRLRGALAGELWYRLMQPTLGLLWAEAVGHLSYRDTWMYVTDGGHYDNLGLVEALRRGARHIVVLDASGDKANTWFTLGGSIALARTDAGVDITLDPTTMVTSGHGLAPGQVVRPWAYGTFSRPNGAHGLPQQGDIWVCKLGWWTGAPWDVLAYARDHSTYPCDSTLEQLYDAAEFEAYHHLGRATVLAAATQCTPPLQWIVPRSCHVGRPGRFAVSILSAGQEMIARRFASHARPT
jgi:Patatin-like phospholipase